MELIKIEKSEYHYKPLISIDGIEGGTQYEDLLQSIFSEQEIQENFKQLLVKNQILRFESKLVDLILELRERAAKEYKLGNELKGNGFKICSDEIELVRDEFQYEYDNFFYKDSNNEIFFDFDIFMDYFEKDDFNNTELEHIACFNSGIIKEGEKIFISYKALRSVVTAIINWKPTKTVYTYLMIDASGLIKIGKTTDIGGRIKTFKIGNPTISLVAKLGRDIEKHLHNYFIDKHHSGEWYNLSERDIEFLVNEYEFVKSKSYGTKRNN